MKQRILVLGDVHGGFLALKQCLKRSEFDYKNDILICLGDVADGWTETFECFEELFKIKNLIYIRGNHDQWLKEWLQYGRQPIVWTYQGGQNTIKSYLKNNQARWKEHLQFLKKTKCYYELGDKIFVHGGFKPDEKASETPKRYLMWDRDLWDERHSIKNIKHYKEVFVGHTSIWRFSHHPIEHNNVWFLDTGGGWEGKLTIMDIDTKKFWQSDVVQQLYTYTHGRTYEN